MIHTLNVINYKVMKTVDVRLHSCVGESFHTEQKKSDFLSTMNKFINEA